MDDKVKAWRAAGRHLPKFLRDFHDQKDTFKSMHLAVDVEKHEYAGKVDWVTGQCYIIDIFLWHMARHGYVLRKAAQKLPFDDIQQTNEVRMDQWRRQAAIELGLTPIEPAP